jgi:hypothetical protein
VSWPVANSAGPGARQATIVVAAVVATRPRVSGAVPRFVRVSANGRSSAITDTDGRGTGE